MQNTRWKEENNKTRKRATNKQETSKRVPVKKGQGGLANEKTLGGGIKGGDHVQKKETQKTPKEKAPKEVKGGGGSTIH